MYTFICIAHMHTIAIIIHITVIEKNPVLRQMGHLFFGKCLVNHEDHFIIPSVSSTVDSKHFSGLATGGFSPNDETPKPGKYRPSITYKTIQTPM